MVGEPEVSRMIEEFERQLPAKDKAFKDGHNEQQPGIQQKFAVQVYAVVHTFEEMGNSFTGDSKFLFAIDTKDIMKEKVVNTIYTAQALGN